MIEIESLTDEQWQRIYDAREEYIQIGTCTEPADRPPAEAAIGDMYQAIGKERPTFIWVDGPLSMCIAGYLISNNNQLGDQLRDQLEDQLGSHLWTQLEDQLWGQLGGQLWEQLEERLGDRLEERLRVQLRVQLEDQLGSQLGDQLWRQLWDQLEDQLWGQLGNQLWNKLRIRLGDQLRSQLKGQLRHQLGNQFGNQFEDRLENSFCGQEQIWWAGHYLACSEIVGTRCSDEQSKKLDMWIRLAKSCGWWLPYEGICIVSERYKSVSFDEERRLHCETGPAIECRDGYTVYAWHGTNVPEEWIENRHDLDPSIALTWENIEQRRAAAEIIGWDRVLDQLENRLIDSDQDPMIGDLIEVDLPDAEATRFLRVKCGTGRTFAIPVPPQYTTALEANAATYGIEPSLLRQMNIRT